MFRRKQLSCSFCGRPDAEVEKLVAGAHATSAIDAWRSRATSCGKRDPRPDPRQRRAASGFVSPNAFVDRPPSSVSALNSDAVSASRVPTFRI
jgi:ClpX C4-type zinc finger